MLKNFFSNLIDKDNSKRKKLSGNIIFLLAPLLPLFIFILLFAVKNLSPFGPYVYLTSDMYHQYAPFLAEMSNKLHSGASLLYSWNIGLGTNFTSLYAYYLASPLNFLTIFFPQEMVPTVMNAFIIIKLMLASLFMSIYISKHFKSKHLTIIAFALLYSMSGYIAAYAWNIMWLDTFALLPLVMLGLERLMREKKFILFTVSLALSILFNYYLSIMIVIVVIIYFVFLCFKVDREKENFAILKRIGLMLLSAAIALGVSAILILPELETFRLSASSSNEFPTDWKLYQSFLATFSRHLTFAPSYTWLEHFPNVFCGTFMVGMLPLFFLNSRISIKEKIIKGSLIAIFILSFSFNITEYIWHGLHFPNCLPARQSFIYIFFLITMAYELFSKRKYIKFVDIAISIIISAAYLACILVSFLGNETLANEDNFTYSLALIIANAAFFTAYFFVIFLYKARPNSKSKGPILTFALIFTIVLEVTLHMNATGLGTVNFNEYRRYDKDFTYVIDTLKKDNKNNFFRTDQKEPRTANDGAWYSYPSINTFSSTANAGVSNFYKAAGAKAATNSYQSLGSTMVLDMLLNRKYVITKEALLADDPAMPLVLTSNDKEGSGLYVYENKYCLPLGYAIDDATFKRIPSKNAYLEDSIEYQNTFIANCSKVDSVFEKDIKFFEDKKVDIHPDSNGHMYLILTPNPPERVSISSYKNNSSATVTEYDLDSHNRIIDIGYVEKGDLISIKGTNDEPISGNTYILNYKKLQTAYERMAKSAFKIDSMSDTEIKGRLSLDKTSKYLFTIPYEKGWSVYVDGIKYNTSAACGAFLSIDLPAGNHNIVLKYFPAGESVGIVITVVSTAVLLGIIIYLNKKKRRK